MVASASDAGFDCTVETFERVSADSSLRFRETGFRGPETTRPKSPLDRIGLSRDRTARSNARQLRAIRRLSGNLQVRENAWWAREDSNLQPDRYERTCAGQWKGELLSILRDFCFCLTRFGQ